MPSDLSPRDYKVPGLRRREKDRDKQGEHVERQRTEEDVCHRTDDQEGASARFAYADRGARARRKASSRRGKD